MAKQKLTAEERAAKRERREARRSEAIATAIAEFNAQAEPPALAKREKVADIDEPKLVRLSAGQARFALEQGMATVEEVQSEALRAYWPDRETCYIFAKLSARAKAPVCIAAYTDGARPWDRRRKGKGGKPKASSKPAKGGKLESRVSALETGMASMLESLAAIREHIGC